MKSKFQTRVLTFMLLCFFAFASSSKVNAQILVYTATLSGANEAPSNASPATGTVTVTINTTLNTMRVQATFSGLTGNTTASHIHAATANANTGTAGVATQTPSFSGFPTGVTAGTYDNTFDMTLAASFNSSYKTNNGGTVSSAWAALQAAIAAGKAYFNIHSSTFGGGEIRGFLTAVPVCTPTASTFTANACGSYIWVAKHNTVYTSSNTTDTIKLVNAHGCDSIVTLNLTIKPITSYTFPLTICAQFLPYGPYFGHTVTKAGNDTLHLTNYVGCDSLSILTVTVQPTKIIDTAITVCDQFTHAGVSVFASGVFDYTYSQYITGCDSIWRVHLTVKNSTTGANDTIMTCDSTVWHGTTYSTTGNYTYTVPNAVGCDSVMTLKLTINQTPHITAVNAMQATICNGDSTMLSATTTTVNTTIGNTATKRAKRGTSQGGQLMQLNMPLSGTINSVWYDAYNYVSGITPDSIKMVIYNEVNGRPGTIVAATSATPIVANTHQIIPLNTAYTAAAGNYWVYFQTNNALQIFAATGPTPTPQAFTEFNGVTWGTISPIGDSTVYSFLFNTYLPLGMNVSVNPTITWSPSAGLQTLSANSTKAKPTATTKYYVTATGLGGCSSMDSITVTVTTPTTYYADADNDGYGDAATSQLVCIQPTGYVTNNTDCDDAATAIHAPIRYYLDTDNDGFGGTGSGLFCNITAPTGYAAITGDCNNNDPLVHVTQAFYVDADNDGYGSTTIAMLCSSTTPAGYSTNNLDCNDAKALATLAPIANAGVDRTICKGDTITIGSAAIAGTNYYWYTTTKLIGNRISNPNVFPTTNFKYILLAVSAGGCRKFDTMNVTIKALPTINAGADISICPGLQALLGFNIPYSANTTYQWTPALAQTTANGKAGKVYPTSTTSYVIKIINTISGCSNRDTVKINILTNPTANAGPDKTICSGDSVTIGSAAVSGLNYYWYSTTSIVANRNSTTNVHPKSSYIYSLLTIDANGCRSKLDTVVINVKPQPIANAGIDKLIVTGSSIRIGTTAKSGLQYAWSPTTNLSSSTIANPISSATSTTNYVVKVTNTATGCMKNDTMVLMVAPARLRSIVANQPSNNDVVIADSKFTIYPNPSNGIATITFAESMAISTIEVVNMQGQLINIIKLEANQSQVQLQQSNTNAGMYLVIAKNIQGEIIAKKTWVVNQ